MKNRGYWWWYPNSYPTGKGIHFSFRTMNFALRFMRKFKTMPFYLSVQNHYDENYVLTGQGMTTYAIKILKQDKPTEEQIKWLNRCNPDKKEKLMKFDEFKRGYRIYEGPKLKHGPSWYVDSLDYLNGKGYHAHAAEQGSAIWTLQQTFNSLRNRGEL